MTSGVAVARPSWLVALNPPIYLVSILPGLAVPALHAQATPSPEALWLATLAVVLLQHAINLFNDAADWRLGADVEKYSSWVRVHDGRAETADRHGALSLVAGGLLGLWVLSRYEMWWLLAIGAPLLLLGYLYNAGRRPLSYTHFGEWVTGICYGPGVFGCLWLVSGGGFDAQWLAGSLGFGMLAMALLLSHQPPQIDTDRAAGKNSFAVRYGAARTRQVAVALLAGFLVAFGVAVARQADGWHGGLVGVVAALPLLFAYSTGRPVDPRLVLLSATPAVVAGAILVLFRG